MSRDVPSEIGDQHERRRGRTIIDLKQHSDGEWIATQHEVSVCGSGETAPEAALDYCRQLVDREYGTES